MNYKINFVVHNYTFTEINTKICLYVSIFCKSILRLLILLIYIFLYIYINCVILINM